MTKSQYLLHTYILITHFPTDKIIKSGNTNSFFLTKFLTLEYLVNLEVGHRFILEQSIGHMGKQRSTNRDLNSI